MARSGKLKLKKKATATAMKPLTSFFRKGKAASGKGESAKGKVAKGTKASDGGAADDGARAKSSTLHLTQAEAETEVRSKGIEKSNSKDKLQENSKGKENSEFEAEDVVMVKEVAAPESEHAVAPAGATTIASETQAEEGEEKEEEEEEEEGSDDDSDDDSDDEDDGFTAEQREAIAARIAALQGRAKKYECKQREEKLRDLCSAVPNLTEDQASIALEFTGGNEMEAAQRCHGEVGFLDSLGAEAERRARAAERERLRRERASSGAGYGDGGGGSTMNRERVKTGITINTSGTFKPRRVYNNGKGKDYSGSRKQKAYYKNGGKRLLLNEALQKLEAMQRENGGDGEKEEEEEEEDEEEEEKDDEDDCKRETQKEAGDSKGDVAPLSSSSSSAASAGLRSNKGAGALQVEGGEVAAKGKGEGKGKGKGEGSTESSDGSGEKTDAVVEASSSSSSCGASDSASDKGTGETKTKTKVVESTTPSSNANAAAAASEKELGGGDAPTPSPTRRSRRSASLAATAGMKAALIAERRGVYSTTTPSLPSSSSSSSSSATRCAASTAVGKAGTKGGGSSSKAKRSSAAEGKSLSKSKSNHKSKSKNKNKNTPATKKVQSTSKAKGGMAAVLDTELGKQLSALGWSDARVKAYMHKEVNPNAYFYRFLEKGEKQATGSWTADEKRSFLDLIKDGVDYRWGILSMNVPGRVGYQCSNYYRKLVAAGEIEDPNYSLDEKGKLKFKRKGGSGGSGAKIKHTPAAGTNSNTREGDAAAAALAAEARGPTNMGRKRKRVSKKGASTRKKKSSKTRERSPVKAREVKPQWGDLELLPGFKDPMTMQRCNDPAISPQGYVMGYSTWMRVLNKTFDYDNIDGNVPQLARNTCPFTKQKVTHRQLVKLTPANFSEHAGNIVNWDCEEKTKAEAVKAANEYSAVHM